LALSALALSDLEPLALPLAELELDELEELELEELELEELELELELEELALADWLDLLPGGERSSVFTDDLLELGVTLIEDLVAGALSALLADDGGGGVGVGAGADFDTEADADAGGGGGGGGGVLLGSSFLVLSQPLTTTPSKTTSAKRRQRQ
jgi:hypothetical protein